MQRRQQDAAVIICEDSVKPRGRVLAKSVLGRPLNPIDGHGQIGIVGVEQPKSFS